MVEAPWQGFIHAGQCPGTAEGSQKPDWQPCSQCDCRREPAVCMSCALPPSCRATMAGLALAHFPAWCQWRQECSKSRVQSWPLLTVRHKRSFLVWLWVFIAENWLKALLLLVLSGQYERAASLIGPAGLLFQMFFFTQLLSRK